MTALAFLTVASGHSGVVHPRTGPALSDIALFVVAALGVWLARRAMRKRFATRKTDRETAED